MTRVLRFVTASCCVFVIACSDSTGGGDAIRPIELPLTNRIVFSSNRADSLRDLFVINTDGSDLRKLTDTTTRESCPALSPDGNWIVAGQVSASRANKSTYPPQIDSIYVMRADGTNRTMLQQADIYRPYGIMFCPQWSAASDRLLLGYATEEIRTRSNRIAHIAVVDRAGNIISSFNYGADYTISSIDFSPDGTQLLISSANQSTTGPPSSLRIMIMQIDGTGQRVVINLTRLAASLPRWSPSGKTIAYNCGGICTVESDGTNHQTLYADPAVTGPAYSLDGNRIAFGCRAGGASMCVLTLSDKSVKEIPVTGATGRVTWTQDNTIIFECTGASADICVVKPDGTGFRNLTADAADDRTPSAR